MAAVSLVWRSNRCRSHAVCGGPRCAAIQSRANQIAVAYRPFRRFEPPIPGRIFSPGPVGDSPAASASTVHLPAGIYEVTGTTAAAATGRLRLGSIAYHHPSLIGMSLVRHRLEVRWRCRSPSRHWRSTRTRARRAVHDASIAPRRWWNRARSGGSRGERRRTLGSAVVFSSAGRMDEPAGIWIAGGSRRNSPSPNRLADALFLRNGSADNS